MKHLSILGSTGSIGRNTLAVVQMFPEKFSVKALTAKNNIDILADQIMKFHPELAVVFNEKDARTLRRNLPKNIRTEIAYGPTGYKAAAVHGSSDTVVSAMVGAAGLIPTVEAIAAGKHIALANKESLVMAGDIVMALAAENKADIRPVDSEHSAIFQCINGNRKEDVKKIFLTASGGPFRTLPSDEFPFITPQKALAHPTWRMGEKISIDSATLMNKGLEVIEAKHLFDVSRKLIEVVIHPQSIIHSMVAFRDGSVLAQMGHPDMKGAIAYALSYPERMAMDLPVLDFAAIGELTFEAPDLGRFPCLSLAYQACETGGTMPCVLNAANEVAVHAFLKSRIPFTQIPEMIDYVMCRHTVVSHPDLEDILEADRWARNIAEARMLDRKN
jgi:1-deoxy-D-xylulose-5-phosphate reductoisomerase